MLKQEADNKPCKPVQLPNLLLMEPLEAPKSTLKNKYKNGSINSEESSKFKPTDK